MRELPVSEFSLKKSSGKPYTTCKVCSRQRRREYLEEIKKDPVRFENYRNRQAAYMKVWDKNNPEKRAAISKKYRDANLEAVRAKEREAQAKARLKYPERVKERTAKRTAKIRNDPALYQKHLEDCRMYRRLRMERAGGSLETFRTLPAKHTKDKYVLVDPTPFLVWLRNYMKENGVTFVDLAEVTGVDASKLASIARGKYKTVSISTIDKLLTTYGGPPYQSFYPDLD
jgi:hypothetical protein